MIAANEVPVWVAILIGLGGGLLATLLSISHERAAEFRTRMLNATDDYLQATMAVMVQVFRLQEHLRAPEELGGLDDELKMKDAFESARVELIAGGSRMIFLFGQSSRTADRVRDIQTGLLHVAEDLDIPDRGAAGHAVFDEYRDLEKAYNAVVAAAREDLRETAPRRALNQAWRNVARRKDRAGG